jgi:hypothetical protein
MRKVHKSNLFSDMCWYYRLFSWFFQCLRVNLEILPQITCRQLASKSFPSYHSSVTLKFDTVRSETLAASLHKPQQGNKYCYIKPNRRTGDSNDVNYYLKLVLCMISLSFINSKLHIPWQICNCSLTNNSLYVWNEYVGWHFTLWSWKAIAKTPNSYRKCFHGRLVPDTNSIM